VDITIVHTIPDNLIPEYKAALLRIHPVPLELTDPDDPNSELVPIMSENSWLLQETKRWSRNALKIEYNRGLTFLRKDMQTNADEVIQ